MFRAGFDAGARADALIDINDWMEREGLRNSRLDCLGQASGEASFPFAVATVIESQCKDQWQEV
jgi:hypothetical protein